jgi:hypothetical protein
MRRTHLGFRQGRFYRMEVFASFFKKKRVLFYEKEPKNLPSSFWRAA